jgi:putative nucleotidyltransferase-like protein
MTDPYWRAVTALGRLGGASDVDLTGLDPVRLHDAIVQSKVVRIAVGRLARTREPVLDLLRATDEAERQRHAGSAELTRAAVAAAAATGARVIKGLAVRPRYPAPEQRHFGDIDLHTADWPTARALAARLRAEGWPWDLMEFPWLKWDEAGLLYGQLAFLRFENGKPFSRVDIHIGAFSVGHAGRMPLAGWEPSEVLGVPVPVPNRESAIALVAAHALGDTRLSMKDINDLHLLVGDGRLDWSSVVELCRCAYAVEVLGQQLAELATVYPRPGLPSPLPYLARLAPGGLAPEDRGAHFAWHVYGDERTRGASEEDAARLAEEARRYFSGDLRPHLADRPPEPGNGFGPGRNVCWRLLPEPVWSPWTCDLPAPSDPPAPIQERELAAGLVLRQRGSARTVLIDDDVFVPTVWGGVDPGSVRLAAETAARVAR